jgi:hypothetical protein
MFGELLLQPCADSVMRQYLPGVDLGEPLLDFADEPVVVVDGSLDGFADQHGRNTPTASRPRQLALEVERKIHFHKPSVPSPPKASTEERLTCIERLRRSAALAFWADTRLCLGPSVRPSHTPTSQGFLNLSVSKRLYARRAAKAHSASALTAS